MTKTSSEKVLALITSEKGGAGKSFAANALLDHPRPQGITVAAYDADGAIGALSKMHGTKANDGFPAETQDPASGVVVYNLRDGESRSTLIDDLAHGHDLVVHDLPGGGLLHLKELLDGGDGLRRFLRAVNSAGYRVVFIHILNTTEGSTGSVATYLDEMEAAGDLADVASHIVMLNRQAGHKDKAFKYWFGAEKHGETRGGFTRERLLALGGVETVLPALDTVTNAEVDWEGITFLEAVSSPALRLSEQQHVANFREDFADAIAPALPLLGVK